MTKPNFNHAPAWAVAWAMDAIGLAYWYEKTPRLDVKQWVPGYGDKIAIAGKFGYAGPWAESLTPRQAEVPVTPAPWDFLDEIEADEKAGKFIMPATPLFIGIDMGKPTAVIIAALGRRATWVGVNEISPMGARLLIDIESAKYLLWADVARLCRAVIGAFLQHRELDNVSNVLRHQAGVFEEHAGRHDRVSMPALDALQDYINTLEHGHHPAPDELQKIFTALHEKTYDDDVMDALDYSFEFLADIFTA